jgi:UDP-N-acetyl-2-amino-2-deoxyglucuronate dehydrogenase
MHRFFDEVELARRWLDEAIIGRVLAARIRNATPGPDWGAWFFRRDTVRNGVADQLGVHGIDLVEHLIGRIASVSARARIAQPTRRLADGTIVDVENVDNVSATYVLDDGTLVAHEMSMTEAAGCDRFRLEIYGENGTLMLRTGRGPLAAWAPDRFGAGWHVPALPGTPFGRRQHEVWLEGVAGTATPLATATDALRGMRVVEATMRSSERAGQDVAVSLRASVAPGHTAAAASR